MTKLLPPAYLLMAILLMAALHFLLPLAKLVFFPWRLLGILPLLLGIILNLLADRSFKRYQTLRAVASGLWQVASSKQTGKRQVASKCVSISVCQ